MKSDSTSDRPFSGGGRRLVPGSAQELAGATAMRSVIASFVTFHTMRYSIFVHELRPVRQIEYGAS
jgi:hypothetical protein